MLTDILAPSFWNFVLDHLLVPTPVPPESAISFQLPYVCVASQLATMVDTRFTANAAENATPMAEDSRTPGGHVVLLECSRHDAVKQSHYIGPFAPHRVPQGEFDMQQFFDCFKGTMLGDNRTPEQWIRRLRVQATNLEALRLVNAAIAATKGKQLTPMQQYEAVRDSFHSGHTHYASFRTAEFTFTCICV